MRSLFLNKKMDHADTAVISFILLGLLLFTPAKAADSTVSAMSAASTLSGTELMYCVQSGGDTKCTPAQMATYIEGLISGSCTIAANVISCNSAHPGYVASNWYLPGPSGQLAAGGALAINTIRCYFGSVAQKVTLSSLGVRVTTAGTNAQFAIYTSASGRPSALIAATGSIDITGTGAKTGALTANKQVGPGGSDGGRDLWFCANVDNAATVMSGPSTGNASQGIAIGSATATDVLGTNISMTGISCAGANCNGGSSTFNTWPASLAGSTWTSIITNIMPSIGFLVNSVP